ncbi:MAG: N-6 DNA methylase [Abditibacteriota bacterium]|nr:N-6 DNA methylase [Abditibacteriota bacterium]
MRRRRRRIGRRRFSDLDPWDIERTLQDYINEEEAKRVYTAILFAVIKYSEREEKLELDSVDTFTSSFVSKGRMSEELGIQLKTHLSDFWGLAQKAILTFTKIDELKQEFLFPAFDDYQDIELDDKDKLRGVIAAEMLDISEKDTVLDCTRIRSGFLKSADKAIKAKGMPDNQDALPLSGLILDQANKITYEIANNLKLDGYEAAPIIGNIVESGNVGKQFAKVFLDAADLLREKSWASSRDDDTDDSWIWDAVDNTTKLLQNNGKAAICLDERSLVSEDSAYVKNRGDLVEKKQVSAVLQMDRFYLLMLSSQPVEKISFLDVSDIVKKAHEEERDLTDEDINEIKNMLHDQAAIVSVEEVKNNRYRLLPWDYIYSANNVLSDIADRLFGYEGDDISDLFTREDTGVYYLRRSSVIDKNNLPRLKDVPKGANKIRNGDIVGSTVIDFLEGDECLVADASVNACRVKKEDGNNVIDPWYLLKMIEAGRHGDNFMDMRIPRETAEKESEIGEAYKRIVVDWQNAVRRRKELEKKLKDTLRR